MSYAHNQRRKIIREFKRLYPKDWYKVFRLHTQTIVEVMQGPPLGTLEDIMGMRRTDAKEI
jgi:predicted nucleotidyltransferase component of viral defense system